MDSDADADIYETYLIALIQVIKDQARQNSENYNEDDWELENKAKRWGGTNLNIYPVGARWEVLRPENSLRLEALIDSTNGQVNNLLNYNFSQDDIEEQLETLKLAIREYKLLNEKIKRYLSDSKLGFMMKYTDVRLVDHDHSGSGLLNLKRELQGNAEDD